MGISYYGFSVFEGEHAVRAIFYAAGLAKGCAAVAFFLGNCGLIKCRKQGNKRFYSVSDPAVFTVIDAVNVELVDALSKRVIEQIV